MKSMLFSFWAFLSIFIQRCATLSRVFMHTCKNFWSPLKLILKISYDRVNKRYFRNLSLQTSHNSDSDLLFQTFKSCLDNSHCHLIKVRQLSLYYARIWKLWGLLLRLPSMHGGFYGVVKYVVSFFMRFVKLCVSQKSFMHSWFASILKSLIITEFL